MRSTICIVTLSLLITWSCEQQQEQQQQVQEQEPLKHHNLSIMLKAIDADMPLSLQHSIAACCSIIRECFAPITDSFMVSTYVQGLNLKKHVKDFLNNVLLNLTMLKVEIESKSSEVRHLTLNRKFNLIVVDDFDSLRLLDPANFTRNYDIQEYYLVYLMHGSRFANIFNVVNQMLGYFWQNSIINVALMTANKESVVDIYTYFPFDNYLTCKMPLLKQINYYSGSWSKPIGLTIFPLKTTNLQSCALNVAVWNTPPYFSYVKSPDGFYKIDYFEAELLEVLSEKLNFSLNLQEPPNNEQRGKVLPDGTITGAMKMLYDHTADLSLGSFRYTLERTSVLTAALPYYQTYQVYSVLTTTQLYTPLEILVYPFDKVTWICLFLSVQLGFIIAFIIDFFYDKSLLIKIAIGSPRIRAPSMNIIRLFMGQSLIQIPKPDFSRFMIISWHLYGLLLRTAYQSLLFQLLKLNLYHEPPQTLTDLINQRCSLVMTENTYDSVNTVPRIQLGFIDVIKLKNTSEQSSYFFVEYDKQLRCLASVSPKDYVTYHAIKEQKRGLFYVLPETIFTQHITMYFSKHSYLIHRFNELFMSMRSMGLIDFWAQKSLDTEYLRNFRDSQFKPLNFGDMEGILIIYGVLILICIVVFFLEIIFFELKILIFGEQYEFIL